MSMTFECVKFSTGNGTVLVYADIPYAQAHPGYAGRGFVAEVVMAPLEHLGVPRCLVTTAMGFPGAELLNSARALIIAHEGLLATLTDAEVERLVAAIRSGLGFFCLDHRVNQAPQALLQALELEPIDTLHQVQNISFVPGHGITTTREPDEQVHLPHPVSAQPPAPLTGAWRTLLQDQATGAPLLACRTLGAGRVVQWFTHAQLWTKAVYGHGMGLDDVFWKSLVWMCQKPMVLKAMPPFVTLRLDDCQGSGGFWYTLQWCLYADKPLPQAYRNMILERIPGMSSSAYHFGYLDVFHRHGFHVHLGVYPDQIRPDDMVALQRYWQKGWMELSIHAFADYFSADKGKVDEFLYMHDHVPAGSGGYRVIEESEAMLKQKFAHVDAWLNHWGLKASPVVNTHWANPGVNSLPFLKARGWQYMMFGLPFGAPYDQNIAPNWRKGPYGHNGFILDYMPVPADIPGIGPKDFFNAEAHPYDYSPSDQAIDFASGDFTMKMGAQPVNDIAACADKMVYQIRRGLDARFFACPMTHEQGLAVLTLAELDDLLQTALAKLGRYELIHKPYAEIAAYAKAKVDTHISHAEVDTDGIKLQLEGEAQVPLQIEVYTDGADVNQLYCTRHTIAPFTGSTIVNLPV